MNVAVLGAGGTIAPAIVADLAASAEIGEILLLDLDEERAAAVGERHGAGRTVARRADARDGLAGVLGGVELLINSASYRVNLDAMQACLEVGCHYADLGGLYWLTGRQLELHDKFVDAGCLAVLGIGSSPGKTNVMARRAVRELDRVASIDVCAAGRDPRPAEGLSVPYALQTLLDELTMAPIVLRGGRPVELAPMTDGGEVDFGTPIGVAPTINTLHSELATFGTSFGAGGASFRLSLAPALLERLRGLVGASSDEVAAAARAAVPPSDETVSVHVVEARGAGRVVRVRALTRPHQPFGIGGSVVSTAAPVAALARLLARGQVTARGALPPEACLEPELLFGELEARSCSFELEIRDDPEVSVT